MKNKDLETALYAKLSAAIKTGDETACASAFGEFAQGLEQEITADARELVGEHDTAVLAARGIRQLTSEEMTYFTRLGEAMRSPDPKMAVINLDIVMPKTEIDAVMDGLTHDHPLLSAINFVNTSGMIEYYLNTNTRQLATWGALGDTISTEMSSGFVKLEMGLSKLSCWIPVAQSMLDLGPQWLENYVRTMLTEAIYYGLEDGIVNGTGKNQPIGMTRKLSGATDGVYPNKTATAITALTVDTYASMLATLADDGHGDYRSVPSLLMVVNPVTYYQKVMPAVNTMRIDGTYNSNVFPYPTNVVVSTAMAVGKAVFGIGSRYFMGIGTGTGKSGKLEYSDEYKFLEEVRTYKTKLYGYGRALAENDFIFADISGLTKTFPTVNTKALA